MRASFLSAGVLTALVFTACAAPSQREFGVADVESITQLRQEFVVAYNAKDAPEVASLFSGEAAVMPPNASTLRGTEAIETYFESRFALGASDLEIEQRDVSGSGGLAYVSGDYSLNIVPPDGGPSQRDRGKFLWIVRDFNGRWLLGDVIFSSDFPPAVPAA